MEFLKHPSNVLDLAAEIIKAVDAYWSRAISEHELREIITYWAIYEGKKFFKAAEYNPTLSQRVGKRRLEVVSRMLEGLQTRL